MFLICGKNQENQIESNSVMDQWWKGKTAMVFVKRRREENNTHHIHEILVVDSFLSCCRIYKQIPTIAEAVVTTDMWLTKPDHSNTQTTLTYINKSYWLMKLNDNSTNRNSKRIQIKCFSTMKTLWLLSPASVSCLAFHPTKPSDNMKIGW